MIDEVIRSGIAPDENHSIVVTLTNGRYYSLSFEHMLSRLMCVQERRLSQDKAGINIQSC